MALCLGCVSALCAGLLLALGLQRRCFPYVWSDLRFLLKILSYGLKLELFRLTSSVCTVLDRFVQQAQRIPDKPFVVYDGRVHTYRDVDARSNRLARVFHHSAQLKKGECVAVLMSNEPDFICVWFGLAKAGCSVAFLNTNIRAKSLLHCFRCCGASTLIVGSGNAHLPLERRSPAAGGVAHLPLAASLTCRSPCAPQTGWSFPVRSRRPPLGFPGFTYW